MDSPGLYVVPEGGETGVDGVQQPEAGHLALGEFIGGTSAAAGDGIRPRFENLDKSLQQRHQTLTGTDMQRWRDVIRVVDEMPRAVAANARDGQRDHTRSVRPR